MDEATLLQRRDRTHAIVEGALLGDIAIVFLLMRAYLPVPVARQLIWTIAAVPFVMLTQRRGIKMTLLAMTASYVLFSALVGPLLALAAINVGLAAILIGAGRRLGLGPGLNTLLSGPIYAVVDIIIPTIAGVIIFRYPVKQLVDSAHHFVRLLFDGLLWLLGRIHAPSSFLHDVRGWESWSVDHWPYMWVAAMVVYATLNIYLVALVSYMVLNQIPQQTLSRQKAA